MYNTVTRKYFITHTYTYVYIVCNKLFVIQGVYGAEAYRGWLGGLTSPLEIPKFWQS
jgi:hypothetical protein